MKRIILIIACLVAMLTLTAQDTVKVNKENKCLFGYVSDIDSEFEDVQYFITNKLELDIIQTCEAEKLIYVKLNKKYKDYTDLFAKIERKFSGECFYKSSADVIIYWDKCRDVFLKEKEKEKY